MKLLSSLPKSTLREFLASLAPRHRPRVLWQLTDYARAAARPASPAELGHQAWARRWKSARHLDYLNRALGELATGATRRLIVTMPPRHGKSVLVSQFLPAWYLGTFPERRVLLCSYEAGFAAEWGRKARDLIAEHGRRAFGVHVRQDSAGAARWDLAGHTGGMATAGVGGPITGRGADLLIVDDPVKNAEQAHSQRFRDKTWDWWSSTAFTRLEPGGAVVLVQTRWHEDDLAGRVLRDQAGEGWQTLCFPALAEMNDPLGRAPGDPLWPERFDRAALERIRTSLPVSWWESLYQQRPSPHESVLWPREYFDYESLWFDHWPTDLPLRVLALDPSKGSRAGRGDYSAYVLLGVDRQGMYWADADMSNTRPPMQLVEDGLRLLEAFRPDVFRVEGNAWQDLLAPLFVAALERRGLVRAWPEPLENRTRKSLRIESLDRYLRGRQIRFRRTSGGELLVRQLREFPVGPHDDGPDALEMAIRTAQSVAAPPPGEQIAGVLGQ